MLILRVRSRALTIRTNNPREILSRLLPEAAATLMLISHRRPRSAFFECLGKFLGIVQVLRAWPTSRDSADELHRPVRIKPAARELPNDG